MANSYVEYTTGGTGTNQLGQTTFTVPTNFININDINAKGFNGSIWTALTISSRATNTITLSATPTAGSYSKLRVYRQTSTDPLVDFVDGARLTESDLDAAYRQGLYAAQEVSEDAGAVGTTLSSVTGLTLGGTTATTNVNNSGTVTTANLTATGTTNVANLTASGNIISDGMSFSSNSSQYQDSESLSFTSTSNGASQLVTTTKTLPYQKVLHCTFIATLNGDSSNAYFKTYLLVNGYTAIIVNPILNANSTPSVFDNLLIGGTGDYNTRKLNVTLDMASGYNPAQATVNVFYGFNLN